jgi:hypothetical protein
MARKFSKGEAIRFGWNTFTKHAPLLVGVFLIIAIVQFFFHVLARSMHGGGSAIILLLGFIVEIVLSVGLTKLSLKLVAGKPASFRDLIDVTPELAGRYLGVWILYVIAVGIGSVLLIIPGIYLAFALSFACYIVVDQKTGVIQSLKESRNLVKGEWWNVFFFGVLLVLLNFLGAIVLFVGLFVTAPISILATVYVYTKLRDAELPGPVLAEPPMVQSAPTASIPQETA